MKVAYINTVAGYGSTGRIVDALATMPGVEGKVYYGRKENLGHASNYRMTHFFGNAYHAMRTFLGDDHGFVNQKETEEMLKDLDVFQPDVVHLHNLHGYYLDVKPLFAYLKEKKIPVVWTLHDCWAFTGHCAHYEAIACDKWKTECKNCPALNQYPVTWNGKNVKRNFQTKKQLFTSLPAEQLTLVTPSSWLKEQLKESFLQGYQTKVVHTGIDTSVFCKLENDTKAKFDLDNQFVILACANPWTKEKGFEDLGLLIPALKDDQRLVVVGVTKKQKQALSSERVLCIEHTNHIQEMVELYNAADVFINPTYQDTFPTVNMEALACECPIITYQTGGSTELVDANTGVVVEKGNVTAMNEEIQKLYRGKTSYSKEACRNAVNDLTKEAMLQAYEAIYKQAKERV